MGGYRSSDRSQGQPRPPGGRGQMTSSRSATRHGILYMPVECRRPRPPKSSACRQAPTVRLPPPVRYRRSRMQPVAGGPVLNT